jgi:hypothetical protein
MLPTAPALPMLQEDTLHAGASVLPSRMCTSVGTCLSSTGRTAGSLVRRHSRVPASPALLPRECGLRAVELPAAGVSTLPDGGPPLKFLPLAFPCRHALQSCQAARSAMSAIAILAGRAPVTYHL